MLILAAVFVSDAFIAYFSGRYLDARQAGQRRNALTFSALLDLAIGVNAMGFVTQQWVALIPSVLGGLLGTWYSLRRL